MLQVEQVLQEHYQLQRQLGCTAAGRQTWLATDLQSNEHVTLNLLAFSPQIQWEELKLFEREAQVLQALNHPRIRRYRDYFSLDQQTGSGITLVWIDRRLYSRFLPSGITRAGDTLYRETGARNRNRPFKDADLSTRT